VKGSAACEVRLPVFNSHKFGECCAGRLKSNPNSCDFESVAPLNHCRPLICAKQPEAGPIFLKRKSARLRSLRRRRVALDLFGEFNHHEVMNDLAGEG